MSKVSIIIPVYNGEAYIERCLETVIKQTLKDIEIIIINDGSTDNTLEKILNYQNIDSRIRIINKKNEGIYKARLDGIKNASCQYIGFVDSDDRIETTMFEKLYEIAVKGNYDIVNCSYFKEFENGRCERQEQKNLELYNVDEIINEYFVNHGFNEMMWSKLFKKELFNGYEIIDYISTAEDYLIFSKIISNSKSLCSINEPLYYYLQRENSIMSSKFSDKKMNRLYAGEEVLHYYQSKNNKYTIYCMSNICFIIIYLFADIKEKKYKKKYYKMLTHKYREMYFTIKNNVSFLPRSKRILLRIFNLNPKIGSFLYNLYIKLKGN